MNKYVLYIVEKERETEGETREVISAPRTPEIPEFRLAVTIQSTNRVGRLFS